MLHNAKKCGAKEAGVPFDLPVSFFEQPIPDKCEVLGLPISREGGLGSDSYPNLDRIVPELGYVVGNVRWISGRANRLKSDATPEESVALARDAQKHAGARLVASILGGVS